MGYLSTSHTQDLQHLYTHTQTYFTYLYILYMSAQDHATSTTRGEQQKFGILHTSGCLMVDVPPMDHLWHSQKDCPSDKEIIWSM